MKKLIMPIVYFITNILLMCFCMLICLCLELWSLFWNFKRHQKKGADDLDIVDLIVIIKTVNIFKESYYDDEA